MICFIIIIMIIIIISIIIIIIIIITHAGITFAPRCRTSGKQCGYVLVMNSLINAVLFK